MIGQQQAGTADQEAMAKMAQVLSILSSMNRRQHDVMMQVIRNMR